MTRLISRNRTPPGGWFFRQIETGWEMPKPLQQSFIAACKLIASHRRANPHLPLSTDLANIGDELEQFTVLRINGNPSFCVTLTTEMSRTYVQQQRPSKRCRTCGG